MGIRDHFLVPLVLALLAMALGYIGGYGIGLAVGGPGESTEAAMAPVAPGSQEEGIRVEVGRQVYAQFGCVNCHGNEGQGGVVNANSATGELVPGLIYVREAYTPEELKALIRKGVPVIGKLDPEGPTPPLLMPPWEGAISARQLNALVQFLFYLYPEEEELDW